MAYNKAFHDALRNREVAKDNRAYKRDIRGTGRADRQAAREHSELAREAAGYQKKQATRMEQAQRNLLGQIDTGEDSYNRTKADMGAATAEARRGLNPWRKAGVTALGDLQDKISAGPGEFTESPGYQFRLDEGQKAIGRSAAARGGALSGAAVKGAMRFGQDFATNDYDNFLRRYYESMAPLERMSGQGMQAAGRMGDYSMQGANQLANFSVQNFGEANRARQEATNQMAGAMRYGGESQAGGAMNEGNIMAAQRAEQSQRENTFNAWKAGNQQAIRAQYGY
jgi:hypothetical protein